MNRPTSTEAERIFDTASELEPSQRQEYLDAACKGDDELRQEVQALLDAADASGRYFEQLPGRLGIDRMRNGRAPHKVHAEAGQWYGQYRLTTLLGTGGMGEVWRAERSDGRFEGEVAVKLLTRLGSRSALKQFDREANYLAKVTHANIARLIDAGVATDGIPYLILDYVDGVAIDEYCDANVLSIERRLRLFVSVLEAVAHAHARLIVHSDIKPSNVLVTQDGVVKLLDFGISTLLTSSDSEGSSAGLTPEYAAPEQLHGSVITTATDIYSLGLLLYQLLAGNSPRHSSELNSLEQLKELANRAPPSLASTLSEMTDVDRQDLKRLAAERGASPGKYMKTLRGELDNIVRKALAVDPSERYLTAADFANDLRRYMRHDTVSAVPDTLGYRTRKFTQRHRGGVLMTILTLIALLAAAAITTMQSIEARWQRDVAIRGQERALATNNLLNMLLGELGPSGEKRSLQEVVDRGVKIVDEQYGLNERSTAMTYFDLSILYGQLGQVETQIEMLDKSESIGRTIGDDGVVANALCTKARLKLEIDATASAADLANGLAIRDRMPSRLADQIIGCYRAEGFALSANGDHDAAIAAYSSAIDVLDDADVSSLGLRMTLLNDLAEQYYITDRPADALSMLDAIIASSAELGRDRTVTHTIYLANRGAILARLGEILRASESQLEVVERTKNMDRPPVAMTHHYAMSLVRLKRLDEALPFLSSGYRNATESGNKRWQAQIATGYAEALAALDRFEEAESYLAIAEPIFVESPAVYSREILKWQLVHAKLLLARGEVAAARDEIDDLLSDLQYPSDKSAAGLSAVLWSAAQIALETGDYRSALDYSSDQLDIAKAIARSPDSSADVGQALHQRAQAKRHLGDTQGAKDDLRQALQSLENGLGKDHPETKKVRVLLESN
ncbi:MAG TPA: protein kinase [Woeseiaceae bacterium]|nr:protein kinase [Woeseiaceae bacterium]